MHDSDEYVLHTVEVHGSYLASADMIQRVYWSHLDLCSATKVCDCVATPQISVIPSPSHFLSFEEHFFNGSEHF